MKILSSLPTELIDAIVDEILQLKDHISTLGALSLVSRSFTPSCQQRLWNTAILTSDRDTAGFSHRRSLIHAQRLICSPHLAAYVRHFRYRVLAPTVQIPQVHVDDLNYIASALKLMTNVIDFDLTYGRKASSTRLVFSQFPGEWQEAIVAVTGRKTLRSLSLKRVSQSPAGALQDCVSGLDKLDLYRVSLEGSIDRSAGSPTVRDVSDTSVREDNGEVFLRSLVSDFDSYCSLRLEPLMPDFHHLKLLELTAHCPLENIDGGPLCHATSLETLRLDVCGFPEDADRPPIHVIFEELSPTSYPTLRHLRLTLLHRTVESFIRDPLLGLCGLVLPSLSALHSLKLSIHITSPFDVNSHSAYAYSSHGRSGLHHTSWTKLDAALAGFKELQEVQVRVQVKYLNGFDERWYLRKEVAEAISESILAGVYPNQFRCLCRRRDEGQMNFDFSTVVIVG